MTKTADRAETAHAETSQAELQRLISLLRATLESTADGILVVDREGRIVTTNRQFASMWRIPPDVITSRDDDRAIAFVLDQVKHPERFLAKVRELYATPEAESFDVLEFKDGRVFARYSRPQTIEGRAVGRVWSFRDITESRRAEDVLRKERAFLRQILDINPHFVFAKDREGRFTLVNRAVAEAYGTTVEDLIGKTDGDFNPNTEEVEFFRRADLEVMDSGREKIIPEEPITDSTGTVRWLQTIKRPVVGEDGRAHQLLGVATDITERRRSEEVLRQSEERFAKAFRASPAPVSISRLADGRYLDVNDAFVSLLGCGRDEILHRTSLELDLWVDPRDRGRFVEGLERDGSVRDFRTTFRTRSREAREVVIAAELIEVGKERCILAISADVTERRRLEEQLLQAQKLEAVGRLAGGIAHDFNNLLTTILGYSELILRTHAADAPLAAEVGEIRKASERAASLTRQLLAFSRKQVIEPRVLDLNALVLDTSRMLRPLIGEDIELATELEPTLSSVRADPVQIEQVIVNLAVNARDAMPRGGRLSIATSNVELAADAPPRGTIHPGPGRWVRITVRDTGTGMDSQTQARVFEPFFTTKEKGKGTGLGLSTAYGIVKQSGGFIFVSSEPGRGATFEVSLPAVPGPPSPLPMDPVRLAADLDGRETILLAEDEEGLRRLNQRVLEARGYAVLPASNAHEALDIAGKTAGTVDILVTDVIMPGPSGRELALRLLRSRPGLKVLYVSGYLEGAAGDANLLEPGANFLQKPFTPDVLVRKVREILDA